MPLSQAQVLCSLLLRHSQSSIDPREEQVQARGERRYRSASRDFVRERVDVVPVRDEVFRHRAVAKVHAQLRLL